MTPHEVTSQWWDHATMWNADDPYLSSAGHSTDGGRVIGITRMRYAECDGYGCRPVVVIELPDGCLGGWDVLVNALVVARERTGFKMTFDGLVEQIEAQTNPTPPKPDEPMGLGAVVEDQDGEKFVRYHDSDTASWAGVDAFYEWRDVRAVRVLSEGVQ